MVCLQCYLPPILFMLYMKFLNPILAPYIQPLINQVIAYFWGSQATIQAEGGCPLRPKDKKQTSPSTTTSGTNEPTPVEASTSASKSKDD